MKADIYEATVTQDATGKVSRTWTFVETVDCVVRGVLRKGIGDNSTVLEIDNYLNMLKSMLKMRSQSVIATDRRVVNIRNDAGVIFLENQDPTSAGGYAGTTIFEPRGSTPLFNFDGSVIEYETMLMRQEVQRLS